MKMKPAAKIYTALIFLFLFAPIAILLVFSFNATKSLSVFSDFSVKWYRELFKDEETLRALQNTLVLAVTASIISTAMGTAAAVGIHRLRRRYLKTAFDTVTNIPMMNPDIITGISLMLMFVFVGRLFGLSTSLSFWTMLIAHITFCLPYVILQVLPKLQQMDPSLPEAAMDLGCTPLRAFFRVEVPEILPGIITGLMMAFTLSLDDFVISYFTQGNGFQTLPIRIYNMTKKTVTPKMYALATIIFFTIRAPLLLTNLVDEDDSRRMKEARNARRAAKGKKPVRDNNKRGMAIVGTILGLTIILIAAIGITRPKPVELNVYNWGEYISDGSEDTLDTIKAFEEWYLEEYGHPVKVNYETYASNEDMYAKLKSGAVSYDLVIPSDYMIARMAAEDMLVPLNYANIPNYQYISESFRGLYYDPDDTYTVPYTYGVVGIIYDANQVDEEDLGRQRRELHGSRRVGRCAADARRAASAREELRHGRDLQHDGVRRGRHRRLLRGRLLHDDRLAVRQCGSAVLLSRADQLLRGRHVHPEGLPASGAGGDLHQLHAQRRARRRERGVHLLREPEQPRLRERGLHRRDGRGDDGDPLPLHGRVLRHVQPVRLPQSGSGNAGLCQYIVGDLEDQLIQLGIRS